VLVLSGLAGLAALYFELWPMVLVIVLVVLFSKLLDFTAGEGNLLSEECPVKFFSSGLFSFAGAVEGLSSLGFEFDLLITPI